MIRKGNSKQKIQNIYSYPEYDSKKEDEEKENTKMQNTKVMRKNTMTDKLKEIKNNNISNLNQNQNQIKNQNINDSNYNNEIPTNKLIKFNQQVNPKRSKSKNGSKKETSTSKAKIYSNTNIPYIPSGQKNFEFSLKDKSQNSIKTNQDHLIKKKTNLRNSTSKDKKGDFHTNSEIAGKTDLNLNWNNKDSTKQKVNSFGVDYDEYEKEENINFTKKINISSKFDYENKKINNNLDNLIHKQISTKIYINNFNTDQNMRNTDDDIRNKQTPPKYNKNDYDEDYQMLEESKEIENTGNTEPIKINEIKNIKIQKKNQRKKKSNDSDEENPEPCPSKNFKITTSNYDLIDINVNNELIVIPKNNTNVNKKPINNNNKIVPLGNRDNSFKNKNNIEAYFPKENKAKQQKQKFEENFYEHVDSLENKEDDCGQEEEMMIIEENKSQTHLQNFIAEETQPQMVPEFIEADNTNFNYQQVQKEDDSNKENMQPIDITLNANENMLPIDINSNLNQSQSVQVDSFAENQGYTTSNTRNENDSTRFMPILAKYEKQIPLEYIPDIWKNLKISELSEACEPHFERIYNQRDINFDMRAILIDWIVEVHKNYHLLHETLFLTVSIIDRYLSIKTINRTKLQLLGTTALFIASKYEEICYPYLSEFSNITDSAYNKEEILEMEREILKVLNFDLTYPSSFRFFEIISLNYNFSEVEFFYGCYLMEYFLLSSNNTKYYPSIIALAVVLLILRLKRYDNYRDLYNLTDPENQRLVKECAREIYEFPSRCRSVNLTSVFTKYSSSTYHSVAVFQMENIVSSVILNSINNNSIEENKENIDPNTNN